MKDFSQRIFMKAIEWKTNPSILIHNHRLQSKMTLRDERKREDTKARRGVTRYSAFGIPYSENRKGVMGLLGY